MPQVTIAAPEAAAPGRVCAARRVFRIPVTAPSGKVVRLRARSTAGRTLRKKRTYYKCVTQRSLRSAVGGEP